MKITFLCSESNHPINAYLERWINANSSNHQLVLARKKSELSVGEMLFLVSCSEIISSEERNLFKAVLVLHASDLPRGRGWSPHIWQIINGAEEITLTLLEAGEKVDTGKIWKKIKIPMPRHLLWNEINHRLFSAEIDLIEYAIGALNHCNPIEQVASSNDLIYPRRKPEDSQINPNLSLADQFDQIRVCDPQRFPAYFELHGHRYKLFLEKFNETNND